MKDEIGERAVAMLKHAGYVRRGAKNWNKIGSDRFSLQCELQTKKRFAGTAVMTVNFFVLSPAYAAFVEKVPLGDYVEAGDPLLSLCLYPPVEASFVAAGRSKLFYDAPEWLWDGDAGSIIGEAFLTIFEKALSFCDALNSAPGLISYYSDDSAAVAAASPQSLKPFSFFDSNFARAIVSAQVGKFEEATTWVNRPDSTLKDGDSLKRDLISWLALSSARG